MRFTKEFWGQTFPKIGWFVTKFGGGLTPKLFCETLHRTTVMYLALNHGFIFLGKLTQIREGISHSQQKSKSLALNLVALPVITFFTAITVQVAWYIVSSRSFLLLKTIWKCKDNRMWLRLAPAWLPCQFSQDICWKNSKRTGVTKYQSNI